MNLDKLKKYLEFKLEQLIKEKHRLQDEYKNIKETKELPSNHNELTNLKNTYRESVTGFQKMLPISNAKLLDLYIKRETKKVEKKLTNVIYSIDEIRSAIKAIKDNDINAPIYPNNLLVKIITEYAVKNSIDQKELLITLLKIFKHNPDHIKTVDITYNMELTLTKLFNEDGTIKDNLNIKPVLFTLNKLFDLVDIDCGKSNNKMYISILNKQLEIEYYDKNLETLKKAQRQRLIKQKQAIEKLKEYVDGTRIIKSCNLYEFERLLKESNIDYSLHDELIANMVTYIDIKKFKNYKKTIRNEIKTYVSEENISYIEQAIDIVKNQEGPTIDMINRSIEDVISICRYLNMGLENNDLEDSLYVLETKLSTLKALVLEFTSPKVNYSSDFMFISDDNNIPYALYNLGSIDDTRYVEVYKVIEQLNNTRKHKHVLDIDDVPIYSINNNKIEILYTFKEERIVIIRINNAYTNEEPILNESMISKLKSFLQSETTIEDIDLAGTQAKVLDIELNLDNSSSNELVLKNTPNNGLK